MKRLLTLLIVITLITSCKTKLTSTQANQNLGVPKIKINSETELGEQIKYSVTNSDHSNIILLNPTQINVEKLENNTWRKLKIKTSPCGAAPIAPREFVILKPQESISFEWNQKESWCEHKKDKVKLTDEIKKMTKNAEIGLYRIVVLFKKSKTSDTITHYKNFEITE